MSLMFFLGVDVSKKTLSVVLTDHKDKTLWSNKSISNDEIGFKKLVETVIKNVSKKAAGKEEYSIAAGMEATGVYGERLAYYLNGNSHNGRIITYVLNPAAVRAFGNSVMAPNKNDSADAQLIASYLSMAITKGQISPWKAPSPEGRALKELSRRRDELIGLLDSEYNRLEKLECMQEPSEAIIENVNEHICYLKDSIRSLEKEIEDHIDDDPRMRDDIELMRSIPGIGEVTSVTLQGESDGLSNFTSVKGLVSFVGIAPSEHTSGTSVHRRSKISRRGNARIRHHLYMATLVATRVNPVIKEFYERLLNRGKCKKLALVACMRKMLHIIWGVIKTRKSFDPCYSLK